MPALQKIIDIQNVGRFEKLTVPGGLCFSRVTTMFGENGWGKSTLADILRSLALNQPAIIKGRETLATGGQQKVLLLIDGQQSTFDGAAWTGSPSLHALWAGCDTDSLKPEFRRRQWEVTHSTRGRRLAVTASAGARYTRFG